ncbi:MAG: hypothetical protein H5T68_07510 [Chloroflexi bacterium]|nr:hypothetical protein [Chloroflexota bacterium]
MNGNKWALAILALALVTIAITYYAAATAAAASQPSHRAGLVIQLGDGSYITRCIPFAEDSLSGLELLMRSGLHVVTWGGAVCRIDQDGCDYPTEPCFCQCTGAKCLYWSYWHWREGRWVYSQVGAADYLVRDGDIEGWAWSNGQPPPVVPVEQICARGAAVTANQLDATTRDSRSTILMQYAAFALMTAVLVGSFFFLHLRRQER